MEAKKHLILVVDDIEQNVSVISQMLRQQGYNVMAAFSGETALRIVEKRLPDLILLDVMMPGIDGFEVCQALKKNEKTSHIPVIFLSALSDTENKVRGLEVGGVDFISKPFQESEAIARVNVHLRIAALEAEREQNIAKLMEVNNEKDRLMQIVSHDLRSPLGGIRGLAEILTSGSEAELPDVVREFSGIIVSSADSLLQLVNDLLDIAKAESGTMQLSLEEFDVVDTARNCVEFIRIVAEKKGVTIQLMPECSNILMTADEAKIMQLTNNLISNAVKFTEKGGTVSLGLREANGNLILTIADSGIGMPPEMLPRVFEKFGKHQRHGTSGEKGTGLGMAIVQRFVTLHHGDISVASEFGVGTTFTVKIPLVQP